MNIPPIDNRRILPSKKRRIEASGEVAPDRTATDKPNKPFFDRRKGDRRAKTEARGKFDSRTGTDRRKRNLGYPVIRTEV